MQQRRSLARATRRFGGGYITILIVNIDGIDTEVQLTIRVLRKAGYKRSHIRPNTALLVDYRQISNGAFMVTKVHWIKENQRQVVADRP